MVNLQGQLVGINTAILAPGGGNIGIGFAIPVNMVRVVMMQLIKYGSVQRGLMGVMVQDFTPALADAFHLPNQTGGALVASLSPNSPAAVAGIQAGDIIQSINGQTIQNAGQLRNAVGMLRTGSEVSATLLRDGKPKTIAMVIVDPRKYTQASEQNNPFLFGTSLRNFDQQTITQGHVTGVQILTVDENSMLWRTGLRPGDVIVSANLKPVKTVAELQTIAKQSKEQLLLNILRRNGSAGFVVVK
jgi:serine protease Do